VTGAGCSPASGRARIIAGRIEALRPISTASGIGRMSQTSAKGDRRPM
jgi:hypothetical protein